MSERETQIAYHLIYMQNLIYDTNALIYKIETDSQTQGSYLWLPRGGGDREGEDWESGITRCELVQIGWVHNKVLLYSTEDYI